MVALYTLCYNFIRIHKTLENVARDGAGLSATLWSMDDLREKMDAVAPKPVRAVPTKSAWPKIQTETLPPDRLLRRPASDCGALD